MTFHSSGDEPQLGGEPKDNITGNEPMINDGRYKWVNCMMCGKPTATEPKPQPKDAIMVTVVICRNCYAGIRQRLQRVTDRLLALPVGTGEIVRIGNHEIPVWVVEDDNE